MVISSPFISVSVLNHKNSMCCCQRKNRLECKALWWIINVPLYIHLRIHEENESRDDTCVDVDCAKADDRLLCYISNQNKVLDIYRL
jgi:hypothetical protein